MQRPLRRIWHHRFCIGRVSSEQSVSERFCSVVPGGAEKLENARFRWLKSLAVSGGYDKIYARYVKTARNSILPAKLNEVGFREIETGADGGLVELGCDQTPATSDIVSVDRHVDRIRAVISLLEGNSTIRSGRIALFSSSLSGCCTSCILICVWRCSRGSEQTSTEAKDGSAWIGSSAVLAATDGGRPFSRVGVPDGPTGTCSNCCGADIG